MSSDNTTVCPPPFISDVDYQQGGGYVDGRFCGINPGVSGQRCCLPCPVQDWIYPEEYLSKLKIVNYVGICSVALCCFFLLSFLVLPPERSSRHYLTIGVTLAITFFSIPFVIPLGTEPSMCHDKITPNGQGSDLSCAWTGALLLLGAMGSALWILFRALWLHLRVCWEIDPGRPFMIISILSGVVIPAAFTAVSLTVTGVSYRTGLVCLPNHKHAILTFWAWQVGFAGAALLVQGVTTGYCIWVYLRVLVRGRRRRRTTATTATAGNGGVEHSSFASESTTGSGAARPQNAWRKIRRMLLLQWRGVALTVVMAVESLFYIIVFVAQDTRFGEVAGKANEPDAKTWSACLVLTGGNRGGCMRYTDKLAISQDLVLGSLLLGSLIGTQNFLLLARPSIFIGWWELFRSPFSHIPIFHRRGSDLPLTSLKPADHHHQYPPQTTIAIDAYDYASTGTIPLMSSAPSKKSSSLLFTTTGRPRSHNTTHNRASSSLSSTDLPPITITNPYKLSLPSEREARASLTSPTTRARLARAGNLADTYDTNVRDDGSDAFHASRPATPPPPPLPLNVSKTPNSSNRAASTGPGAASLASAAAPLSLPPPAARAAPQRVGRSATVAHRASAADADAGRMVGVANRHQLPAWAVAATGSGPLSAAERDAMRGGLALHPVGVGEAGEERDSGSAFSSSGSEEVMGASSERRGSRGSRGGGGGGTTLREFLAEGGGGEEGGRR